MPLARAPLTLADALSLFPVEQGRFQLVLMPGAGHALHEDAPEATAAALADFVRRCTVNAKVPAAAAADQR